MPGLSFFAALAWSPMTRRPTTPRAISLVSVCILCICLLCPCPSGQPWHDDSVTPSDFATTFERSLIDGVAACDLTLTTDQVRVATRYAEELLRWNARAGLTTIEEPHAIARRHFVESILLGSLVPEAHCRGLDIGSGGGFPGLALRIYRPQATMTLLEPREAKAAFLRHVGRLLPEITATVNTCRLEGLSAETPWDFACFRGVKISAKSLVRVLRPGGLVLGYSGAGMDLLHPELLAEGATLERTAPIPDRGGAIEVWRVAPADLLSR